MQAVASRCQQNAPRPHPSATPSKSVAQRNDWTLSQLVSRYALCFVLLVVCGLAIAQTSQQPFQSSSAKVVAHRLLNKGSQSFKTELTATSTEHDILGSSISDGSSNSTPADILAAQKHTWPDGYVAVCAVIKDQWPDLRYWIEYHRWLGVSKFYIYDNNSTLPAMLMLWDYMQQGVVEYNYFLGRPRRQPDFRDTNQYRAYHSCMRQHSKRHRWLAFIDVDEFFVFPQQHNNTKPSSTSGVSGVIGNERHNIASAAGSVTPSRSSTSYSDLYGNSLPLFLSEFEGAAAVGINWALFGSSGHVVRPVQGPLEAYTSCVPRTHWESTHVKIIANTARVLDMGGTPHEVLPRNSSDLTVDVDFVPFHGPWTPQAKWHKLVLHHYVLKSKAEFVSKKARGSGAGNRKDWAYWDQIEELATETCTNGVAASAAFLSSTPQLALPQSAHIMRDCPKKAALAFEALLVKPPDGGSSVLPVGAKQTLPANMGQLPC